MFEGEIYSQIITPLQFSLQIFVLFNFICSDLKVQTTLVKVVCMYACVKMALQYLIL